MGCEMLNFLFILKCLRRRESVPIFIPNEISQPLNENSEKKLYNFIYLKTL